MKLDAIALLCPRILKLGILVFVDALIARMLGPERFGLYAYAGAIFIILAQASRFGMDDIIVRTLVNKEVEKPLPSILIIRLFGGTLASTIFIAIFFVDPQLNQFALIALAFPVGLFLASLAIFEPYLQANRQFRKLAAYQGVVIIGVGLVKITMISLNAELSDFLLLVPLEFGIAAILSAYVLNGTHVFGTVRSAVTPELLRARLKEGMYLVGAALVMMAYSRLDQIMLANLRTAHEVAIYSVAYRIPETTAFLGSVICQIIFPTLIKFRKENQSSYERELKRTARILYATSILATVVIAATADRIIALLFGAQYMGAKLPMIILSLMIIPIYFGLFTYRWLILENMGSLTLVRSVAGLALNAALNFILIPPFGAVGASFATVITLYIIYFGYLFISKETRPFGQLILAAAIPWK